MPAARDELIEIQKRWVRDLKRRIYRTEERRSPELDRYYNEYRALFQKGFERVATRAELVRALNQADIAYFGDYHTLKIAQLTPRMLLAETALSYGRRILLGLEMLHTGHQRFADDYVAGKLDEREFLEMADYERTWGFDWPNYRGFFDFAREHGAKIVGLNSTPPGTKHDLPRRDAHAARLIAAASAMHPGHLMAVLFGDLHVGETHLPAEVRRELGALGLERRDLIVYQNSETFYWQLVSAGREQVVDAVKVKKGVYCVMNATPLVKFQSHLNWQEAAGELEYTGLDQLGHEYRGPTDLSRQFIDMVRMIARFLRIEEQGLENVTLYTTGDLDFLSDLLRHRVYSAAEIGQLRQIIARKHSAFFPRARTVYLGSLSVNDAAEMAARFVRFCCAPEEFEETRASRDAFYVACFDEALAIFGGMLVNPRYRVASIADHARFVEQYRGRRLDEEESLLRDISRHAVEHAGMVNRLIDHEWARNNLRSIYRLPPDLFRGVTRALGSILGGQLFAAVNRGKMPVDEVRALFYETWPPGEPFRRYVDLKRRLRDLPEVQRTLLDTL